MILKKDLISLKLLIHKKNENKALKPKVLDNVGDLFNELYYIYKGKNNEEKDVLNTKNKELLYYKKLRLTDDYQYESEEEKQQTSEKPDNKLLSEQPDKSKLPKWVKVNKTRFDVIKSKVQNAKKKVKKITG